MQDETKRLTCSHCKSTNGWSHNSNCSHYYGPLRQLVFQRYDGKCGGCPEPAIQTHHRHYENFGNETEMDLLPVCQECHDVFTQTHRARRIPKGPRDFGNEAPIILNNKPSIDKISSNGSVATIAPPPGHLSWRK